ncbi:hypothetical protein [Teredinibacter franksiae]|uniref:hypothetical protein n=1 Tax=Teredinibacter franksiae TaxID=2761453 RepID=UPI001623B801|nr:hypothetical protein [Teredinibacter franksiae]
MRKSNAVPQVKGVDYPVVNYFIAIVLFLFSGAVLAVDGNSWGSMSKSEKLYYLAGLRDSYTGYYLEVVNAACDSVDAKTSSCAKKAMDQYFESDYLSSTNLLLLVDLLDHMYANPFNRAIDVTSLSELAVKKSKGIDIEKELVSAREIAAISAKYKK